MNDSPATPDVETPDGDDGIVRSTIATVSDASRRRKIEVLTAVMMAMATVGIAWVSFEASRWGTVQTANFNQAQASLVEASKASAAAGQLIQVDVAMFAEAIDAFAAGEERLTEFYVARARDEFKPALDAWIESDPVANPDAAPTPFELPEYTSSLAAESAELEVIAAEDRVVALSANQRSDNYILGAVIFAAILFICGITPTLKTERLRLILLTVAAIGLVTNSIWVANFPVVLRV